jgi:hypothetical protein
MTPASLPESLTHHSEVCETVHQLILQENRCLKHTGNPPDEALLQAKRVALGELTASLAAIQSRQPDRPTPEVRAAAAKTQQIILKALLVDRENEKLLLAATAGPRPSKVLARPPAAQLRRAYSTSN